MCIFVAPSELSNFHEILPPVSGAFLLLSRPPEITGGGGNLTSRLLSLVTSLSGFLVFAFYSAVLTSTMTSLPPSALLEKYEDLYDRRNEFQLIFWPGEQFDNERDVSVLVASSTKLEVRKRQKTFCRAAIRGD